MCVCVCECVCVYSKITFYGVSRVVFSDLQSSLTLVGYRCATLNGIIKIE